MPQAVIVRRLRALRIAVGVLLLVRTTPLLYVVPGLLRNHGGPLLGWPDAPFRAALIGTPLPVVVVEALVVVRMLAAVCFLVGLRPRIAGLTVAIAGYLVWSQEPFSFIFTLHTLYTATALLALAEPRAARSSLGLVRAFVVAIYAWSALAKLHASWLDGSALRLLRDVGALEGPLARIVLGSDAGLRIAAWLVLLGEAALVPGLLLRRTRPWAVVGACILHAAVEMTAHPDVFGWLMIVLLSAFWPDVDRHLMMTVEQEPPSPMSMQDVPDAEQSTSVVG